MRKEIRNLLLNHSEAVMFKFPFFKMCLEFKEIFRGYGITGAELERERFDDNPFT